MKNLLNDEKNNGSSKRVLGMICGIVLCVVVVLTTLFPKEIAPPEYLINAIALLAFGCLGLTSVDKFSILNKRKKNEENDHKNSNNTEG